MRIPSDSRQIPSVKAYTAKKQYHDLLYSTLQTMSYVDTDRRRYVDKKDVNYTALAGKIGVSRQTVALKFQGLEELGLVSADDTGDRYQLNFLAREISSLVAYDTLCALNDMLSEKAISLYVYLLNRYLANQEQEFVVTMRQIKDFLGIACSTTSNNSIINNLLNVLAALKLIEVEIRVVDEGVKNIVVNKVDNKIKKIIEC